MKLSELFLQDSCPEIELAEFSSRGIEYLLEISEKKFIPWRSVAVVALLGVVQMAVGGILMCTALGNSLGFGFVTEGAADLYNAYRIYRTRQFSWSDYSKQKAASLVISVATLGLNNMIIAGRGINSFVTGFGEEALEQVGTRIVTNKKVVGKAAVQGVKNLKTLAFRKIGVATGDAFVRGGLNVAVESLTNLALEQFKPKISEFIQKKVAEKFYHSKLEVLMMKMYALDKMIGIQDLRGKIDKVIRETINPEHDCWRKIWDSVGAPLCKGILSRQSYLEGPLSVGTRIVATLNGLKEIALILDKVFEQLEKKMIEVDKEFSLIPQLMSKRCKVSIKEAKEILSFLKREKGDGHEDLACTISEMDLKGYSQYKSRLIKFYEELRECYYELKDSDLSMVLRNISDVITDQVIRVMESQLISPWSSYGVGKLTNLVSEWLNEELVQKDITKVIRNPTNKKINEAVQILRNARDLYNNVKKKDDEPASIGEMLMITAKNNIEIKIVEDYEHGLTEEEKAKGINLIIYTKGENNTKGDNNMGKYQLVGEDGELVDLQCEDNDSGYAVISHILRKKGIKKSIADLRQQNRQAFMENPNIFSRFSKADKWVRQYYPQARKALSFVKWIFGVNSYSWIKDLSRVANRSIQNLAKEIKVTLINAALLYFGEQSPILGYLMEVMVQYLQTGKVALPPKLAQEMSQVISAKIIEVTRSIKAEIKQRLGEEKYENLCRKLFELGSKTIDFYFQNQNLLNLSMRFLGMPELAAELRKFMLLAQGLKNTSEENEKKLTNDIANAGHLFFSNLNKKKTKKNKNKKKNK